MTEIRVERILELARALAFPRYPGSEGDARAIALVERALAGTGLEVGREPFSYDIRPAFRALRLLLVGAAVLVAAAGLLAARAPLAAALLVAVALAAGGLLLAWSPWLERIYARPGPTETANVIARRPARGAARTTLVLVAHHDSKSQNLILPVRAGATLAALAGALVVGLAVVWSLAAGSGWPGLAWRPPPTWLAPAAGLTAAAALALLSTLRSGDRSPGGVDNAGSVGILVELARVLPAAVAEDVELVFLSTGAEEDHMVGAMRWLDAHLGELAGRPVWVLNLDGAGIPGRVALLERYGFGRRFSPALSRLARRVARRQGIAVRGVLLPPAMGVDAIPFAHRGLPSLTLASGSLGRAVVAVHSPADVADNLDPDALHEAARLALGMILELATSGSAKKRPGPRGPRQEGGAAAAR